jgi:hypothetical protein
MKLFNQCFTGIFLIFLVFTNTAQAQQLSIDASDGNGATSNTVRVIDPSGMGKKITGLSYADIGGSPFWKDNWNSAYLYYKNGTVYKLPKAKLNLYTSEVHYVDNAGVELVAETNLVNKIIFLNKNDTTKALAVFVVLPDYVENKPAAFYKMFNSGTLALVLLQKNLIKVSPYDPITAKNASNFYIKNNYAIYNNEKLIPLKGIDKTSIVSAIPFDATIENWLKENKNKLKSEEDVISLLNYFNSLHK